MKEKMNQGMRIGITAGSLLACGCLVRQMWLTTGMLEGAPVCRSLNAVMRGGAAFWSLFFVALTIVVNWALWSGVGNRRKTKEDIESGPRGLTQ